MKSFPDSAWSWEHLLMIMIICTVTHLCWYYTLPSIDSMRGSYTTRAQEFYNWKKQCYEYYDSVSPGDLISSGGVVYEIQMKYISGTEKDSSDTPTLFVCKESTIRTGKRSCKNLVYPEFDVPKPVYMQIPLR